MTTTVASSPRANGTSDGEKQVSNPTPRSSDSSANEVRAKQTSAGGGSGKTASRTSQQVGGATSSSTSAVPKIRLNPFGEKSSFLRGDREISSKRAGMPRIICPKIAILSNARVQEVLAQFQQNSTPSTSTSSNSKPPWLYSESKGKDQTLVATLCDEEDEFFTEEEFQLDADIDDDERFDHVATDLAGADKTPNAIVLGPLPLTWVIPDPQYKPTRPTLRLLPGSKFESFFRQWGVVEKAEMIFRQDRTMMLVVKFARKEVMQQAALSLWGTRYLGFVPPSAEDKHEEVRPCNMEFCDYDSRKEKMLAEQTSFEEVTRGLSAIQAKAFRELTDKIVEYERKCKGLEAEVQVLEERQRLRKKKEQLEIDGVDVDKNVNEELSLLEKKMKLVATGGTTEHHGTNAVVDANISRNADTGTGARGNLGINLVGIKDEVRSAAQQQVDDVMSAAAPKSARSVVRAASSLDSRGQMSGSPRGSPNGGLQLPIGINAPPSLRSNSGLLEVVDNANSGLVLENNNTSGNNATASSSSLRLASVSRGAPPAYTSSGGPSSSTTAMEQINHQSLQAKASSSISSPSFGQRNVEPLSSEASRKNGAGVSNLNHGRGSKSVSDHGAENGTKRGALDSGSSLDRQSSFAAKKAKIDFGEFDDEL
ncbi:unnamed protein product [Amoebophrya sp. A25]|nr:unnamed protein product [Amoebophrya sp. A25]|eukprot:GSA25T00010429001.1